MNLPNKITVLRIFLTFVFMFFLFGHGFWPKMISLIIFIIAAVTDFCDGWLANKNNMTTDFGKLMDPFADKILILAAFAAFVQMQLVEAWMFLIILARELLVTSLRLFALLNKGKVLSASKSGKHKTAYQMFAIFIILGFIVLKEAMLKFYTWNPAWEKIFRQGVYVLMLIAVVLTLNSGLRYLWKNRKIITSV
ncbi:MAG: CDP-diacylglycerol--glycerol-3-phosphate 3-phosphatidyltransferase [Candidatus Omnitrophica bacterium]|nr:CDP-diacylglycerol--glycerol-3-phosphate 3-phosphatidyltransferase [Candidatus Omnitrophota bacterium]MDD5237220.1 CDP-diacylglycerol--glycerol-3-phosphate 3-phosphatidyltransferase [Candidatus Omnitrophota bacterium]MDD5611082.1 CDP-diacylglycerol--glycerol-3-phosphate 3-phosphatidyltransferase [Candidatus Omnitrophota bacterium]